MPFGQDVLRDLVSDAREADGERRLEDQSQGWQLFEDNPWTTGLSVIPFSLM